MARIKIPNRQSADPIYLVPGLQAFLFVGHGTQANVSVDYDGADAIFIFALDLERSSRSWCG
jgi:hypothetical protein